MLFDLIIIFIFLIILTINIFKKPLKGIIEFIIYLVFTYLLVEPIYLLLVYIINKSNIDINSLIYDIPSGFTLLNEELYGLSNRINEEFIYFDSIYLDSSYFNKLIKSILYSFSLSISSLFSYLLAILITFLLFKLFKKLNKKNRLDNKYRYIYSSFISLISSILIMLITISPYQNVMNNYINLYNTFNSYDVNSELNETRSSLNDLSSFYNQTLLKYSDINSDYKVINSEIEIIKNNNKSNDDLYNNYYKTYLNYKEIIEISYLNDPSNIYIEEAKKRIEEVTKLIEEIEINNEKEEDTLNEFISSINLNYNEKIKDIFNETSINTNIVNGLINRMENVENTINSYINRYTKNINKLPSLIYLNKLFSFSFGSSYFIYNNKLTDLTKEINSFINELNNVYSYDLSSFKSYFKKIIDENNIKLTSLNEEYEIIYDSYLNDKNEIDLIKKYEENYFSSYSINLNNLSNLLNEINELINKFN